MKRKALAGLMLMPFLLVTLFSAIPVKPKPSGTIKIGVLGPMPWIQGLAMTEGAEIAWDEIGRKILGHDVELVFADTLRGMPEPTDVTGAAAATELMAAGCDFVIGGFRTEAVLGAREVFMDYEKIFIITGASANELVDCGDGTCGACVRCNYIRYKYAFRMTPVNSTMLLYSIAAFSKFIMIEKLMPVYGTPLKIAVISEVLKWADTMHAHLTSEYFWNVLMGMQAYGNVSVVQWSRVSPLATDLSAELAAVKTSSARLLIHVLSAPVGRAFPTQWRDMGVNAVPVGINVVGQETPSHWEMTAGKCEYETILAASGTRTPIIPGVTEKFWDDYEARWGRGPTYTSYGAYEAVYAIKEAIEAGGTWPVSNDDLIPLLEQTDRTGTLGNFKFTQYHDVFCNEIGSTWTQGYVRPLVVQWQAGRMEVVWPRDQPYSKKYKIPPWMYVLAETDIVVDGLVDTDDISAVASWWLHSPDWTSLEADMDSNHFVNIDDITRVALDWGKNATKIYGQWPLA